MAHRAHCAVGASTSTAPYWCALRSHRNRSRKCTHGLNACPIVFAVSQHARMLLSSVPWANPSSHSHRPAKRHRVHAIPFILPIFSSWPVIHIKCLARNLRVKCLAGKLGKSRLHAAIQSRLIVAILPHTEGKLSDSKTTVGKQLRNHHLRSRLLHPGAQYFHNVEFAIPLAKRMNDSVY